MFLAYLEAGDFVGANIVRKFLQMGYARARRYANHKGGKKCAGPVHEWQKGRSRAHGRPELPRTEADPHKTGAAAIFEARWDEATANPEYRKRKAEHRALLTQYGERGVARLRMIQAWLQNTGPRRK